MGCAGTLSPIKGTSNSNAQTSAGKLRQIYIETLDDSNYNIYLFVKVIVVLFNDDLSNSMLLIQYKRINILFYIKHVLIQLYLL